MVVSYTAATVPAVDCRVAVAEPILPVAPHTAMVDAVAAAVRVLAEEAVAHLPAAEPLKRLPAADHSYWRTGAAAVAADSRTAAVSSAWASVPAAADREYNAAAAADDSENRPVPAAAVVAAAAVAAAAVADGAAAEACHLAAAGRSDRGPCWDRRGNDRMPDAGAAAAEGGRTPPLRRAHAQVLLRAAVAPVRRDAAVACEAVADAVAADAGGGSA